jgi:hypothetical protein
MERAVEALGEGELLRIAQRLLTKHQHRVAIHTDANLIERRAIVHLTQIDRARFSSEMRGQLTEREAHRYEARHKTRDRSNLPQGGALTLAPEIRWRA